MTEIIFVSCCDTANASAGASAGVSAGASAGTLFAPTTGD